MKFYGEHFYEDRLGITEGGGEGTHQAARRVPGAAPLLVAPGTLLGVWWPPSVPPFRLYKPPGVETPKQESFPCFAAVTGRKPTEEKIHLRRADSAGEITSRKGRSSSSSASSPSPSHLISQLQLVL